MSGTFSQVYIQVVFAVKGRQNLLQKPWRDEVFKYMAGIIKGKNQKSIIVNGVEDHVHLFIGLKPSMSISDLIRDVKNNTTNFINEQKFIQGKFSWQEGYGAFSYSHSQIDSVYQYIFNQEEHHHKKTFKEEYLDFLKKFEIEYDEKYLFEWIED
ncbi:IS200/IS605 family transposase [Flavobacterium sp. ZT3R18]|jgi:putative transposase|uniref:IS200/IS605 family transposase n=1 Tax=Flavobacterium sp. ZT3R18 TaxID=2594429 RepID=UPI00117B9A37|nr:IS200/IS605 family transposase [Flavobacterium sp. ZT3R18]TRX31873.1 IS200/IS605 family transposase [Flavobacterium sp. ZT3R18]